MAVVATLHVYLLRSSAACFASYQGRVLAVLRFFGQATKAWRLYFVQRDHVLTSHFYRLALSELDVVAALRAYTKCSLDTTFSDTVRTTNS